LLVKEEGDIDHSSRVNFGDDKSKPKNLKWWQKILEAFVISHILVNTLCVGLS